MENTYAIVLVIALSLALSFFLSGMEAGVFALSRLRIRQLMRAGKPRAKVLHGYLEEPESFLWTIFVGNTLANFAAVTLAVVVLFQRFGSRPVLFWVIFWLGGFLFYAFCELLPKMLFRTFPNRLCLALVGPFRLVHATLAPLVSFLSRFSNRLLRWSGGRTFTGHLFGNREELRLVMQESAQAFTSEERAMINRVLDLQHLTVGQIATSLEKAATVTTQSPMEEVLRLCRERNLTRLPVWQDEGNHRRIVGVVSLKTLLYLSEEMRLEEALRRMQRSGQRLGIVLGRDQREVGIVSLQDILKFIFGEVSL
jgi:putative hemolysin